MSKWNHLNLSSFLEFVKGIITKNGLEDTYEKTLKQIKKSQKAYVYMKSLEEDYGNSCRDACAKLELVSCYNQT